MDTPSQEAPDSDLAPIEPPQSTVRDFHLQEYGALRAEILMTLAEIRKNEMIVIVSIAAIYAWFFGGDHPTLQEAMGGRATRYAAPILSSFLALVGYGRQKSLEFALLAIADYIVQVEAKFADKDLKGWASGSFSRDCLTNATKPNAFNFFRSLFWFSILAFNTAVLIVLAATGR
ncbi:MAG: hypothetical protein OEL76_01520 [Siculibacillus sp.]|nr:hypothetical protein [Siculibacillus sp.]